MKLRERKVKGLNAVIEENGLEMKPAKKKMDAKKKKKVIRLSVIGGIIVVIGGFFIISSSMAKSAGVSVETIAATKGTVSSSIDTSGTVKSEITRTYFSDATTKTNVQDVNVELGDTVKAGDQLLTYDIADLEANSKQVILNGQSSAFSYQGEAQENAKYQEMLAKSVTDIQNYQALMALQKEYVKSLEDSISDEKIKKRADLYNQQYSLNRSINNFNYELTKEDLETKQRDNFQKLIADYNNEVARVGNELSKLEDYKTKDNREDILIKAKNDYSDLEIAYNEARTF